MYEFSLSPPPQTSAPKCGVKFTVGLSPRVHCKGLLFLDLAVGSHHNTPAGLQGPRSGPVCRLWSE